MSDLSRHLPLSQRAHRDESAVSRNWSTHTGATLLQLTELLASLEASSWERPSMREGHTVRDVAASLAWRLGASGPARAIAVATLVATAGLAPRAAAARLSRGPAALPTGELISRLRGLAADILAGRGGARIADLGAVVLAAYDIAAALGTPIVVDPVASGAVAMARAVSAPFPIRLALGERTLVAADAEAASAEWRVGTGPELRSTAAGIVLFLHGRTSPMGRLPEEHRPG